MLRSGAYIRVRQTVMCFSLTLWKLSTSGKISRHVMSTKYYFLLHLYPLPSCHLTDIYPQFGHGFGKLNILFVTCS